MVIAKIDRWEIAKSDMKAFVALSTLYFQLNLLQRMVIFTRLWYIYCNGLCSNNEYMTETVMFGIKYVEP